MELNLDALTVETFATAPFDASVGAEIVETGCVQPCEGNTLVWR